MTRWPLRSALLAAAAILCAGPASAFTLENGTIWPLYVSIGGAPPQTVPAEQVAFLFRGQCPTGCAVSIAVADPQRGQTLLTTVGGDAPVINGDGDAATVRVRMDRGAGGMTVEIVGDFASSAPTTAISAPFSGSPSTAPVQSPPTLIAPPIVPAGTSGTGVQATPPSAPPPGFIPPPSAPDYSSQ